MLCGQRVSSNYLDPFSRAEGVGKSHHGRKRGILRWNRGLEAQDIIIWLGMTKVLSPSSPYHWAAHPHTVWSCHSCWSQQSWHQPVTMEPSAIWATARRYTSTCAYASDRSGFGKRSSVLKVSHRLLHTQCSTSTYSVTPMVWFYLRWCNVLSHVAELLSYISLKPQKSIW